MHARTPTRTFTHSLRLLHTKEHTLTHLHTHATHAHSRLLDLEGSVTTEFIVGITLFS